MDIAESLQDRADSTEAVCNVWPEHWDALRLFLACLGQIEIVAGAAGGIMHMAARSVNVNQELVWLGLPKRIHAETVAMYRTIEREVLDIINARSNKTS